MSVTKQQQEIIDNVILSYINTNDDISRQYLKLRQDTLLVSQEIAKKTTQQEEIPTELLFQLKQLEFESSQLSQIYESHILRISETVRYAETHESQYLLKLERQYTALTEKKELQGKLIAKLKDESKPVVEKMALLVKNYDQSISTKSGSRQQRATSKLTSRTSGANPDSTLIDYASTIFEKSHLEDLLLDVDQKLQTLRTVDEIDDKDAPSESAPLINTKKYLDELLQSNRAYLRLDGARYSYDIARSMLANVAPALLSLDEYNVAVEKLISEIQGLVEGGALAKERWLSNARTLELIQAVLDAQMEVD